MTPNPEEQNSAILGASVGLDNTYMITHAMFYTIKINVCCLTYIDVHKTSGKERKCNRNTDIL